MDFLKVPDNASSILDGFRIEELPLALLVIAVLLLLLLRKLGFRPAVRGRGPRRAWRRFRRPALTQATLVGPPDISDPAEQMRRIAKIRFETVTLMNRSEFAVFVVLEKLVAERRDGHRLMAQTSLGEIIRPRQGEGSKEDRDLAFRSINSKRLDFAIFDRAGHLALAIEYQGSGHYHEHSFMRDAVKREALRKAGVPLLEAPDRLDPDELARQVRRALSRTEADGSRADGPVGRDVEPPDQY